MTKTIVCKGCGVSFLHVTSGRGRPPVRCEECREGITRDRKEVATQGSGDIETRVGDGIPGMDEKGDTAQGDGSGKPENGSGEAGTQDGSGDAQGDGNGAQGDAQDGSDGQGQGDGEDGDGDDPKPDLPEDTTDVQAMLDYAQALSEWQKRQQEKRAQAEAQAKAEAEALAEVERKRKEIAKRREGEHKHFGLLVSYLKAGVIPFLHGPAGSGKSTSARHAAEELGLSYGWIACHPMMGDHNLFGYMSATGSYVRGAIRDAFENGGVFLIDEIDNGNPQLLAALNGMLALNVGENFIFPDNSVIPRHKDFRPIVAGNTAGRGADDIYVAREALDGATLNRFAYLEWPYDEVLERRLAGPDNSDWVLRVQALRKATVAARESLVITPRTTLYGVDMLKEGIPQEQVEEALIWQGCDKDVRVAVLSKVGDRSGK